MTGRAACPYSRMGVTATPIADLFHKDFALIFRRATERDAEKKPLLTRLFLKNLLRR